MAGALDELGLQVLNVGDTPTFDTVRGGKIYSSIVDITACSEDLLNLVENWRVDDSVTSSDHNGIVFDIHTIKSTGTHTNRTTRIYKTKKANWSQFREKLAQLLAENNTNKIEIEKIQDTITLNKIIEKYTHMLTETCTHSIPLHKTSHKLTLPWWSKELADLKRAVSTRRRRIRCAAPVRRERAVKEYLQKKEEYEKEAKRAQINSWKEFCEKQDREGMWEGIYRVIGRTAKRHEDVPLVQNGTVLTPEASVKLLAETFYPGDPEDEDDDCHRQTREAASSINGPGHDEKHDPPFTQQELRSAVASFNPKKAPGADGFTADICARAIFQDPDVFLALANKCLSLGHFPKIWKEATVVVLRKPGKECYTVPKAYRPIGLLPVLGKVLEKMAVRRLKWHLIPRMSTRQYGFMPQKSTEDSLYTMVQHIRSKLDQKRMVTVVSLDIEGAFDSAWWPAIRVRLAEEKCPVNIRRLLDSYLEHRSVGVRYAGEEYRQTTSKGCVQGSIGGPILWNLLLDPLLKGLEERGAYCQAFADDVALIFDGVTALEIQRQANAALEYVRDWGVRNKLKFAPHKTCAMLVTRKLKYDTPILRMGGVDIGMSTELKILGLTIDNKLTFNTHVRNVCRKGLDIFKQLSRAAKVSWGLHPEVIRSIYTATVEPVIMYASSAWAPATNKLGVQKQLNTVQRGFAQKLCKSYRTVSLNAALVLAGILPLDLRIREAAALYEARKGVFRPELGDREVERAVAFAELPHPATHTAISFECLEDQEDVDVHATQDVRIFTDGSKIDGKVGAALSIWGGDAETKAVKLCLPSYCTVYQAELLALCRATGEILRRAGGSYGVFSDSRAALQTIANHDSPHPLAVEARQNLALARNQNKEVSLFWIRAHAGLAGNERADQLAKEAALKSKKKPDYDRCPVSFAKRQIRMGSVGEWDRRFREGETASVTKLFLPNVERAHKIVRRIQPQGIITQMLTGHGGFSEYLHRFKCKGNPSCICDPSTAETVPHLLLECPVFAERRRQAECRMKATLQAGAICTLFDKTSTREVLLKFMIFVGETAIKRNRVG